MRVPVCSPSVPGNEQAAASFPFIRDLAWFSPLPLQILIRHHETIGDVTDHVIA